MVIVAKQAKIITTVAKHLHFGLFSTKDIVTEVLWFDQMRLCKPKQNLHRHQSPISVMPAFLEPVSLHSAWFKCQCSSINLPFRHSLVEPTSFPSAPHPSHSEPHPSLIFIFTTTGIYNSGVSWSTFF